MHFTFGPLRRRTLRIPVSSDVWVYWESPSARDISRVKDISPSGLFIETKQCKREGEVLHLEFLVQEGQIRLEAVVCHSAPGRGMGLKISSLSSHDAPHLHLLLNRFRDNPKSVALFDLP